MSRYEKNLGTETISVGWDRPLNTFFALVHTNQTDDDLRDLPPVLWLGGNPNEFPELAPMMQQLNDCGYHIPLNLEMIILRDSEEAAPDFDVPEGWVKKQ
ncbi:MAG TPA: hypothetical protein VK308_05980 [Pyrinomonadaceae bacterium]|nr:hypothetical protein [Pyrinomonadaceae bacterium]